QSQQLAARIDDASRQAQAKAETVARELAGRLEETSRQTRENIETVTKVIDNTARQTTEATASLARTLQTEVAGVETRTLDTARKELSGHFETLQDRARQATSKIKERVDNPARTGGQHNESQAARK